MPGLTWTQLDTLAVTLHQSLVVRHDDIAYLLDTAGRVGIASFTGSGICISSSPIRRRTPSGHPTLQAGSCSDTRPRVASTGRAHGIATFQPPVPPTRESCGVGARRYGDHMSDVVLVALISVSGTLAGAFAAPFIAAMKARGERRAAESEARVAAVEQWTVALGQWLKRADYDLMGSSSIRGRMEKATTRLSGVLRKGEGPVREFAVGMMAELDRSPTGDERDAATERTKEILFAWVRGDIKATQMRALLQRYEVGGTVV